jgi:hypothetical protein
MFHTVPIKERWTLNTWAVPVCTEEETYRKARRLPTKAIEESVRMRTVLIYLFAMQAALH